MDSLVDANEPASETLKRWLSSTAQQAMTLSSAQSVMTFSTAFEGRDYLYGGDRRDYISGGDGNDRIVGELGNDILNGGNGYDRFVFGHLHDADIIEDFGQYDFIDLTQGTDHYFVTEVSSGVRIATVDWEYKADVVQGSIVLNGVTVDEWTSWGGAFGDPAGYSVYDERWELIV